MEWKRRNHEIHTQAVMKPLGRESDQVKSGAAHLESVKAYEPGPVGLSMT